MMTTGALLLSLSCALILIATGTSTADASADASTTRHTRTGGRASGAPLALRSFGTGLSQHRFYQHDTEVFNHTLNNVHSFGVMTHFWITGEPAIDTCIYSYYIDDETLPSVQFTPSLIAGTGFDDVSAPWGTRLMGKQAAHGAWYSNLRIPFQKSIRITARLSPASNVTSAEVWTIVKGTENLPTIIGGFTLPSTAKIVFSRILAQTFQPLEFVPLLTVEPGRQGLVFFHVLQVNSGSMNWFEGCYRAYFNPQDTFEEAMILSTGVEDFFVSAYYADGGVFRNDVSGFTHLKTTPDTDVEVSAYRVFHEDPLFFDNGLRMVVRIGDVSDVKTGFKCTSINGTIVGNPTKSVVTSYTVAYVW